MLEIDIQKQIIQFLKLNNIFFWRESNIPTRKRINSVMKGISDLIILHKGTMICIEVKTKKGKQSDDQKAFEQNIKNNGGVYFLARSVEDVYNYFGMGVI